MAFFSLLHMDCDIVIDQCHPTHVTQVLPRTTTHFLEANTCTTTKPEGGWESCWKTLYLKTQLIKQTWKPEFEAPWWRTQRTSFDPLMATINLFESTTQYLTWNDPHLSKTNLSTTAHTMTTKRNWSRGTPEIKIKQTTPRKNISSRTKSWRRSFSKPKLSSLQSD